MRSNLWAAVYVVFFTDPATSEIYTLSLHDALPIWPGSTEVSSRPPIHITRPVDVDWRRSEEHTSELQSHSELVCRLLLEKKKEVKPLMTLTTVLYLSCALISGHLAMMLMELTRRR